MRLLVDTNALIWLMDDPSKLGRQAREVVTISEAWASYFSLFEIALKAASGRLRYPDSILDDIAATDLQLLMPELGYLRHFKIYNPANKDPFDNLLITIALEQGLTFVTSDQKILATKAPGLKLLDARQ